MAQTRKKIEDTWVYFPDGVSLEKKRGKSHIRHTAASFMAEQQGYTETDNQLGHDIGMLLKHYRRAITKTEAEDFYNITPDSV